MLFSNNLCLITPFYLLLLDNHISTPVEGDENPKDFEFLFKNLYPYPDKFFITKV